jgi:hypothetical protein
VTRGVGVNGDDCDILIVRKLGYQGLHNSDGELAYRNYSVTSGMKNGRRKREVYRRKNNKNI